MFSHPVVALRSVSERCVWEENGVRNTGQVRRKRDIWRVKTAGEKWSNEEYWLRENPAECHDKVRRRRHGLKIEILKWRDINKMKAIRWLSHTDTHTQTPDDICVLDKREGNKVCCKSELCTKIWSKLISPERAIEGIKKKKKQKIKWKAGKLIIIQNVVCV